MVAEAFVNPRFQVNRAPGGDAGSRMKSGTILSMGTGLVSPVHLIFLLLLALLLFGAKRLPEIGRSLGTGMREFKDSVTTATDTTKVETRSELPPPAPAAPVAPPPPVEQDRPAP
jgi:sec-independent protein translocase protein TatA